MPDKKFRPTQHDHRDNDSGGVLTNDVHDGYSEYGEIATPSTPEANKGRFYVKNRGGVSTPYFIGDDGVEHDLMETGVGSGHTIQDEGIDLTQQGKLNFTGTAVVASYDAANSATKITINRWEPLANGDSAGPELVYADGDVIMVPVNS